MERDDQSAREAMTTKTVAEIRSLSYATRPTQTLYHYTSLSGFTGIVTSRSLWATEIRYFSDSAELAHAATYFDASIDLRLKLGPGDPEILRELKAFLASRLTDGAKLFIGSFTENGNLLSQWRGYCPPSKGISIGFAPDLICECAAAQDFLVGQCIYAHEKKGKLAAGVIHNIEKLVAERAKTSGGTGGQEQDTPYSQFRAMEADILRIAALFKDGAYAEEQEWRAVSPAIEKYGDAGISYREGRATLVPYVKLLLPTSATPTLAIHHVYVGPTPHINNSMHAVSDYLSASGASPRQGVTYCQIPYREW